MKHLYIEQDIELLMGELQTVRNRIDWLIRKYGPTAQIDLTIEDKGYHGQSYGIVFDIIAWPDHINHTMDDICPKNQTKQPRTSDE